jgi:hypothetical protein
MSRFFTRTGGKPDRLRRIRGGWNFIAIIAKKTGFSGVKEEHQISF